MAVISLNAQRSTNKPQTTTQDSNQTTRTTHQQTTVLALHQTTYSCPSISHLPAITCSHPLLIEAFNYSSDAFRMNQSSFKSIPRAHWQPGRSRRQWPLPSNTSLRTAAPVLMMTPSTSAPHPVHSLYEGPHVDAHNGPGSVNHTGAPTGYKSGGCDNTTCGKLIDVARKITNPSPRWYNAAPSTPTSRSISTSNSPKSPFSTVSDHTNATTAIIPLTRAADPNGTPSTGTGSDLRPSSMTQARQKQYHSVTRTATPQQPDCTNHTRLFNKGQP